MHTNKPLELVKPQLEHGPAYLAMVDDFLAAGEAYSYNNVELAREDFAQFVHELEDEAAGIGLPPHFPAQQTYVLLKDHTTIVGEIRFRPHLSPPYEKYAGHIGYNICPSQRGQGYATHLLALLLEQARALRLTGVSLTIDEDNPASIRVIEKNGGTLLRIVENPTKARVIVTDDGEFQTVDVVQTGQQCRLYWIDLTPNTE